MDPFLCRKIMEGHAGKRHEILMNLCELFKEEDTLTQATVKSETNWEEEAFEFNGFRA